MRFIFHSYSESSTFGSTISSQIFPPHQRQIHRFLHLTAHHSESSTFGRPVLGRSTPCQMAISQIPALLWKLIFGRPSVGRSTPHHMAISQIAALTAHISFLLWQLHIWQTRSWQIYPPSSMAILQIPALLWKLIFGRPSGGRSNPPHQWQFHRFLLYPGRSYLADQVLADLPSHQMAISQIPVKFIFHSYSKSSTFGWPAVGRSTPHKILIS